MKMPERLASLVAAARRIEQDPIPNKEPLAVRYGTILQWAERDDALCRRIRELEARPYQQPFQNQQGYTRSFTPDYYTPALVAGLTAIAISDSFE